MNKNDFVEQQMNEVKATLEALKQHHATATEELKQEPEDDAMRDVLEDCEEGITALEPVLADFSREGVDPEELVKYAATIEEWQEAEAEIAKQLEK